MWKLTKHSFGTDFVDFMGKLIEETPLHQQSAYRSWTELLAAERAREHA